jgi:hypothetical protein
MPRCSQAKCRIFDTGVCLDGHEQGCPHLLPDDPAGELPPHQVPSAATDASPAPEPYRFHSGEKLTIPEASRLLNERPARVVFCAGARRSGKTTFLARLGEMFRDGSCSRYRFAGSLTLCAFERASWLATVASGAGRPDTRRTFRGENDTFLHLYIRPADNEARKLDLLISDLAGETFPTAVASREFCVGLHSLARADHLVMFLDSARLADRVERHPEWNNAREFLQQVRAVKHQPGDLRVQVVFSRWDYITRHPQMAALEKFCKAIEADLIKRFAQSFAALEFWHIAARPDDGTKPTNADIQSLFAYWLETLPHETAPLPARNRQPARDFCAFGLI